MLTITTVTPRWLLAAAREYDECISLMREAISLHLAGMREDGEVIPEPTAVAALTIAAA